MVKRILIKIGTATVTKNQRLDLEWIREKTGEIAKLKNEIILITSGAVGAGMEVEGLSKRPTGNLELQLLSGKGQVQLMESYNDSFKRHNVQTAQVLLTHHNFKTKEEVVNIKNVVNAYVKEGTIPIINTNDVVTSEEFNLGHGFTDNDELAALVAVALDVDLLLILTDVDGLCTKDPRRNNCYDLVKCVKKVDAKVKAMASKEGSIMGLGGMLSKVEAARKVNAKGIVTVVANGKYKIKDVLSGKVNRTVFECG
jgi:glutamate 5-kinase